MSEPTSDFPVQGHEGEDSSISMIDIFTLPDSLRHLLSWMLRKGEVTAQEVAQHLKQDEATVVPMLEHLVEDGMLRARQVGEERRFRVLLAHKSNRQVSKDIWSFLGD
ncbi:FeoC-like transcriptional regulator [Trichothermofontia sp.]